MAREESGALGGRHPEQTGAFDPSADTGSGALGEKRTGAWALGEPTTGVPVRSSTPVDRREPPTCVPGMPTVPVFRSGKQDQTAVDPWAETKWSMDKVIDDAHRIWEESGSAGYKPPPTPKPSLGPGPRAEDNGHYGEIDTPKSFPVITQEMLAAADAAAAPTAVTPVPPAPTPAKEITL